MSIHVQALRDAENVDHSPFLEFCQWAREHDDGCYFGNHYDWRDCQSSIIDLGSLHDEIKEAWEDTEYEGPKPPDIRPWLVDQIDKGITLAYVSW